MFQKIWRSMDKYGLLYHPFPEDRLSSFEQLTIFGQSGRRLSFDPLEGQPSIAIDRVDLFDVLTFDAHDIPFAEALALLMHLVLDAALAFAGQIVISSACATRAIGDPIEPISMIGNLLPCLIGGNTHRIHIMLLGPRSGFAQGGRLVAKHQSKWPMLGKSRIQMGLPLHSPLRHLI